MQLGLRGRILLLVLVALAPPTVIAVVVAVEERNEAREHAQRDVLESARVAAADVRRVMTGTATVLFAFSRDTVGAASGFGVQHLGYAAYFALTFLLSFPALALLPWLRPLVENPAPRP